ncbi:MAG TPA: Na+/H+ antiporter subunit E [Trebonia sp.]
MANDNRDAGRHDVNRPGRESGPLAGEPRRRRPAAGPRPRYRRMASWLTWWILLMALWVALDDSLEPDELLVGAGVGAVVALAVEMISNQAEIALRIKLAWLPRALALPGQVAAQTVLVFAALARTLFTKAPPPRGRFRELPVEYGDDTPLGETRRVLLTAARSLAPNEFVLGIDPERDVMITHELVAER